MDCDLPFCTAVVADGVVTLNPWSPRLVRGGPAGMALDQLEELGVAIADLTRTGEDGDELIATFVRGSARGRAVEEPLVAWARTVGYRRLWLPERVVELTTEPATTGTAEARCPTCRLLWRDVGSAFWEGVRANGHFPGFCRACGGSLPEWHVLRPARRSPGRSRTPAGPRDAQRPACG